MRTKILCSFVILLLIKINAYSFDAVPPQLLLPTCSNNNTIASINNIFSKLSVVLTAYNISSVNKEDMKRLFSQSINDLSKINIKKMIIESKENDICAANVNLALGVYYMFMSIHSESTQEDKNNSASLLSAQYDTLSKGYLNKSANIYRTYAKKGNIKVIRMLCAPPDDKSIFMISAQNEKICSTFLLSKKSNLSTTEQAEVFSAIYNLMQQGLLQRLAERVSLCNHFFYSNYIMQYKNPLFKYSNKDMCVSDFIMYGQDAFSNNHYSEAFKFLSLSNPEKNTLGTPQFDLAYMYQKGLGVKKDLQQAIDWYNFSYTYGGADPGVLNNLGQVYEELGNFKTAFEYYQTSAEQGDAFGEWNLAVMYTNGRGVIQDNVQAYAWASVAAANGIQQGFIDNPQIVQQQIEQLRNSLSLALVAQDSTEQSLNKAKKLATDYYNEYVLKKTQVNNDSNKKNQSSLSLADRLKKAWNNF